MQSHSTPTRFVRYAWFVVAYNLAVIAWGAYVRATGSGAGCGDHWPLCNGEIIPRAESIETLIEFSHRLTSGIDGIFILILFFWAFKAFEKGSRQRRWAALTLFLVIVEGGLGAGLVKYELVADNKSLARGVAMAAHLCNTFLLVAAATLTAWTASGGRHPKRIDRRSAALFAVALAGTMILGMSGAITALGDTLYPVDSFAEGLAMDLSPTAHLFVRLRVFHPAIAAVVGLGLVGLGWWSSGRWSERWVQTPARMVIGLVFVQLLVGTTNVILAAPVWIQMVHLLLADMLWLSLVTLMAGALYAADRPAGG